MNLDQIIRTCRNWLDDEVGVDSQRGWQDWFLVKSANDAVDEINKELQCLTSAGVYIETGASGIITFSGTDGQIDSVTVNGLTVTSGVVPFHTTLALTSSDLADNINAFSVSPNNTNPIKFFATPSVQSVRISAPINSGSTPNGYVVVSNCSGGLTAPSVVISGGDCLCRLFMIPNQSVYEFNKKILKITRFKPSSIGFTLDPRTKEYMDKSGNWQAFPGGDPVAYIPDYDSNVLTIVPAPLKAYTVDLDVIRRPLTPLVASRLGASPDLPERYHDAIIPWVMRQCFLKVDRETFNMEMANRFEMEFKRLIENHKVWRRVYDKPKETFAAPMGYY